jgi:hypothetical protein
MVEKYPKLDFVMQWFQSHELEKFTNRQLETALRRDYKKVADKVFGDPTRTARKLHELGRVQRSPKGRTQYFWYDSKLDNVGEMEVFSEDEITIILEKYDYQCAVCKKGVADGIKVTVGYAVSVKRGGKLDVANGRVLCPRHKFILETAQDSEVSAVNFRKLRKAFPQIGKSSAKGMKFWEEFADLLERYDINIP